MDDAMRRLAAKFEEVAHGREPFFVVINDK